MASVPAAMAMSSIHNARIDKLSHTNAAMITVIQMY